MSAIHMVYFAVADRENVRPLSSGDRKGRSAAQRIAGADLASWRKYGTRLAREVSGKCLERRLSGQAAQLAAVRRRCEFPLQPATGA